MKSTAVRPLSTFASILAMVLAVSTASAQESATATIRSTTRLVQLNVVVVDKHGRSIGGLTQDDFHVFDNGREQKLVHFAVSTSTGDSVHASESPLVISNRSPNQSETPRTRTVILVDEMIDQELRARDLRNALQQSRMEVLKFLRSVQPGEQIAIYALRAEGVVVVHEFTDDSQALAAAAKKLGSGLLRSKVHTTPASPDEATALAGSGFGVTLQPRGDALVERVHQVLLNEAFESIAQQLRYIPGRKNLVYISVVPPLAVADFNPGAMFQERDTAEPSSYAMNPIPQYAWPENNTDRLIKMARSLSNGNIAVYPIDARGLMTANAGGPIASAPSSQRAYQAGTGQVATNAGGVQAPMGPTVAPFLSQWGAMDLIASETGGRAFYNSNGIQTDLREVMDENRVAYILGYYPGDRAWDGKYHKVEVKIDRAGAVVRCRKGYFAKDDPPPEGRDPVLRRAAKSLIDSSGMEVTLNVATNPLRWFNQDVVVKLRPQDIQFEQADERFKAHVEVAFVQIASDGRIVDGIKDDVELALLAASYDQALELGWLYPRNISITPAAEKLRVVVRDVATGAVGSVTVPVQDHIGR